VAGSEFGGGDGRFPGSGGGGGAGAQSFHLIDNGGGGAGQYIAGYLSVTPGDTYRIVVGAGGADVTYPGGAGADGAVIVYLMPARVVEQGTVTLDAQRHFGAAGSVSTGDFYRTVIATNVVNVSLPVQDGQAVSLQYLTTTPYTTVLAGGGTGTTLSCTGSLDAAVAARSSRGSQGNRRNCRRSSTRWRRPPHRRRWMGRVGRRVRVCAGHDLYRFSLVRREHDTIIQGNAC